MKIINIKNSRSKKIKIYFLLILLSCTMPITAFADLPVIDFASLAQLLKEVSWMEQQYKMLSNQYNILQAEEQSVLNQATDIHSQLNALKSLSAFQWTNLSGTLNNLGDTIGNSNGLSYSNDNIN